MIILCLTLKRYFWNDSWIKVSRSEMKLNSPTTLISPNATLDLNLGAVHDKRSIKRQNFPQIYFEQIKNILFVFQLIQKKKKFTSKDPYVISVALLFQNNLEDTLHPSMKRRGFPFLNFLRTPKLLSFTAWLL